MIRLTIALVIWAAVAGIPKWIDPGNWTFGLVPVALLNFRALARAIR